MAQGRFSRRGVSGVISAVILFGMLLTTGAAYFTFVTESQFKLNAAAQDALARETQRKSESISAEIVQLQDGDIGISIENRGSASTRIVEVMVIGKDGALLQDIGAPTLPITLNSQEETASPIDTDVLLQMGVNYEARVVTEKGSVASAYYPKPPTVQTVVSSEIAKSIGSVAMDTTTLMYSQNGGVTWNQGWYVTGGVNTIWRINVTNLVSKDIYLSKYSSFIFMKVVTGGGGQIQPTTFHIAPSPSATSYPELSDPNFLANGGVMLPKNGASYVLIYLKLANPSGGGGQSLDRDNRYITSLELFGKYNSPTGSDYYGQSLPFVGVISPP